jgi:hypothetical protein
VHYIIKIEKIWYQQNMKLFMQLKQALCIKVYTPTHFPTLEYLHVYRKAVLATCFDTWINENKKYFAGVVCTISITYVQFNTDWPLGLISVGDMQQYILSFKHPLPLWPMISVSHAQCTSFTYQYTSTLTNHAA